MAQPDNNIQLSSAFKTYFERETLTGANFNDWYRSLIIVLRVADTYDYLYKPCPDQPLKTAYEEDKAAWKAEYKKDNDASGKFVSAHVLEMKGYMDQLHALGKSYDNDMAINSINRSLNKDFGDFVRNFNMHCVGKTLTELHALLIDYEKGLKDKAPTPQDYALEYAVRIINMVPTKKVDKTPYEIWHGKAPNLPYLKVWGCEAYVKRDSADKLHQRSVKCIFVGYPKETMGYYFYFPPENKVIAARYGNFVERDLISQKFSAMDVEMNSMKVMKVWIVVDLPPNAKVVRSKWLYKKKTDMD
nr:retrotransposon protein, putative, Ty1-copia subclass [Tanacetum cinerariifolium]